MNRPLIRYVATMVHETGIKVLRKRNDDSKIWRFIIGVTFISTAAPSICVFSISNSGDLNQMLIPISHLAILSIGVGGILIVFHHKHIISEALYQMDNNIHTYPDEELFDIQYKRYLKEENVILIISGAICFEYLALVIICLPGLLEAFFYGKVFSYVYPGWTPWKTEQLKLQLLKLAIQASHGTYGVWIVSVIMMSVFVVIFEFLRQFERLSFAIRSLKIRSLSALSLKNENGGFSQEELFHDIMRDNIIQCMKHHQMLQKNFKLFRIWFPVFFSWELAICVSSFALGLYVLLNAPNTAELIQYILIASLMSGNFLGRCFAGELLLYYLNDDLQNILFGEIEWCEMNKENRKLLVMFHQMISRPFYLYGFSVFGVTRITFAKIVRITYSAFNIINVSFKKT